MLGNGKFRKYYLGSVMVEMQDAAEIQALIRHHASAIVGAIDGGGIKPSKCDELERTCVRMLALATALSEHAAAEYTVSPVNASAGFRRKNF